MLINIYCAKCIGIQAVPVNVEVDINSGIGIHLVGLADIAVKESLLRIMTALQSLGFHIPGKKIVINLAPADMHKNGSGYDLPIALGIIAASGQRNLPALTRYIIMGELGLDASVRPVAGAIPIAEFSAKMGLDGCILPKESAMEASELQGIKVFGVSTLTDVLRVLENPDNAEDLLTKPVTNDEKVPYSYMDFADIVGQEEAKRGLEIAAAGGHNAIMIGSPGSGKTSMAKAMIGIMPQMTTEEAIETSKIYSVAGQHHTSRGLIRERPFRAPHYSASLAAIIGGGNGDNILPGEVSLAENGILVAASEKRNGGIEKSTGRPEGDDFTAQVQGGLSGVVHARSGFEPLSMRIFWHQGTMFMHSCSAAELYFQAIGAYNGQNRYSADCQSGTTI